MALHPWRTSTTSFGVVLFLCVSTVSGQWLAQPTAGIPRTPDGKADLSAPVPRTHDGRPDLSGLWEAGTKFESDLRRADIRPWALDEAKARQANVAADSWSVLCLPAGPMIDFTGPLKIVQTAGLTAILYEVTNSFRQIFTDGRELPKEPNPTWQGYSVGHWEEDTLVVETIGFNDRSRVGRPTYPHSEELRVTERFRRRDFGHIDVQMTIDDPKTFTRPWRMTGELVFQPDTEMLEFVCNENEKDRAHFVQTQTATADQVPVDVADLARYAGTYELPSPNGTRMTVTVTRDGDSLIIDVPGRGRGPLVPQSATTFLAFGAVVEFIVNDRGEATHLIAHIVEGDLKGPRTGPAR